jgi:hypothetical protein
MSKHLSFSPSTASPFTATRSLRRGGSLLRAACCMAALTGAVLAPQMAHAAPKKAKSAGIEPWAGRRVVLLLPLQLGEGWNADRNFGTAILPRAEQLLQEQLQKTGKFSVIQANRSNPLIQRGLQEKRLTEDQVKTLTDTPSVENATTFLSQFAFERPAMIVEFRLEEVRAAGDATRPSVQAQVSGRLYQLGNGVATKSPVVTSEAVRAGRNNIDRYLGAADNAFMLAAAEMVAPLEDIALPMVIPTPAPAANGTGANGAASGEAPTAGATGPATVVPEAPTPVTPPAPAPAPAPNVVLPGNTPITGSSSRASSAGAVPQLPAARPPLGITVPGAATPQ